MPKGSLCVPFRGRLLTPRIRLRRVITKQFPPGREGGTPSAASRKRDKKATKDHVVAGHPSFIRQTLAVTPFVSKAPEGRDGKKGVLNRGQQGRRELKSVPLMLRALAPPPSVGYEDQHFQRGRSWG